MGNWGYNPLFSGVITLVIAGRGLLCGKLFCWCLKDTNSRSSLKMLSCSAQKISRKINPKKRYTINRKTMKTCWNSFSFVCKKSPDRLRQPRSQSERQKSLWLDSMYTYINIRMIIYICVYIHLYKLSLQPCTSHKASQKLQDLEKSIARSRTCPETNSESLTPWELMDGW